MWCLDNFKRFHHVVEPRDENCGPGWNPAVIRLCTNGKSNETLLRYQLKSPRLPFVLAAVVYNVECRLSIRGNAHGDDNTDRL
jgi:hypothetical protein